MKCRHCYKDLNIQFLDLGRSPPSNAFLSLENLKAFEKWYPLKKDPGPIGKIDDI